MSEKSLGNLQVYQTALELSAEAWNIYTALPREFRFDMGSQLLRAVDSIGANIAEGYGRFHYKDKTKFYYNARGSLWEAKHWLLLLRKRALIDERKFSETLQKLNTAGKQLNGFIASTGAPNDQ
jgi:four helix bundle protein